MVVPVRHTPKKCEVPGCGCTSGPFYLYSRCHMEAPMWPKMDGQKMVLECSVCGKPVGEFEVVSV